jgi:protein SCO1/2
VTALLVGGVLAAGSLVAGHAVAGVPAPDPNLALATSQEAIGRQVGDYGFRDSDGAMVRLADFRGRPLVVAFIYTACASTCPVLIETLADNVDIARRALGQTAFSVIAIGFDVAHDTPLRLASFAAAHGVDASEIRFLSGDANTIDSLARDLGFAFYSSTQGYDHLSQTSVLDAGGRVVRQIYGESFDAPLLVEPLKALAWNSPVAPGEGLQALANQIKLFCTVYDPASGRYRFDISLFIGFAIGAVCLGGIGSVIVRAWIRSGRRNTPERLA